MIAALSIQPGLSVKVTEAMTARLPDGQMTCRIHQIVTMTVTQSQGHAETGEQ